MSSEESGEVEESQAPGPPTQGAGKNIGRRRLLQMLALGGGLAAAGLLPKSWTPPSVDEFGTAASAQSRLPLISDIPRHSPRPSMTPMPTPGVSVTPPPPTPSPSPAAGAAAGAGTKKPGFTG